MSPFSSMSVERKLPLLMTAVLAIVMAVAVSVTYRTLGESAETAARERMLRGAQTITITIQDAIADRFARLRTLTAGPIRAAARSRDTVAARRILDAFRGTTDNSTMELWDASGHRLLTLGDTITPEERSTAFRSWLGGDPSAVIREDSAVTSPMYHWNGRVHFWFVAPVRDGARTIGFVAHRRRLSGSAAFIASLTSLVGDKANLHMRNRANDFWATAPGLPAPRPVRRDTTDGGAYDIQADGTQLMTTEVALAGTPWIAVLQVPRASIMARPRALAIRLSIFGGVLALLGAIIAAGFSRRITRPLASLSGAAQALAHGEHASRAVVQGDDEIGHLARTFNSMADEIESSRAALEQRTRDAEAARAEAERSNRAKADFLAVMSHELRTPLNAIAGYTELLRMGLYGDLSPAQRDALARIESNQHHLLSLINEVLHFAKIDAGQMQYVMRDVPVHEALTAVEPLIAPQLRSKSQSFESPIVDSSLVVHVDPDKLQQVLLNLLANAVKFTPIGGAISLDVSATDDRVRILVRDTGPGIAPQHLPTIFEPFDQGDRALNKPHEGVGLGLAIARDLARGMGGDVEAESMPGTGSVFTVTLVRSAHGSNSVPAEARLAVVR